MRKNSFQDSGSLTKDGKPSVFHFLDHHTTDAKYNKLYNFKKGHEHILTHIPFLRSFSVFAMLLECIHRKVGFPCNLPLLHML